MSDSDDEIPELKMAQPTPPAQIAKELAREQTNANRMREVELEQSLAPFRVGSVPYLNSVPLNRGLEDELVYEVPSKLATMLRAGELDAALLSITEALFHDGFDILDGVAVASLGEVKSVFLAHKKPLEEIETVLCDPASCTSVELMRIVLGERGIRPKLEKLTDYESATSADAVLMIGDPAIRFLRGEHDHQILDLGTAWFEMTNLPFVYAAWVLKRGVHNASLRRQLREAKDFGVDTLDHIISDRTDFDLDFRKDYLGWHIHFHLGADEKRGLAKFVELLRKHNPEREIFDPVFV